MANQPAQPSQQPLPVAAIGTVVVATLLTLAFFIYLAYYGWETTAGKPFAMMG